MRRQLGLACLIVIGAFTWPVAAMDTLVAADSTTNCCPSGSGGGDGGFGGGINVGPGGGTLENKRANDAIFAAFNNLKSQDPTAYKSLVAVISDLPAAQTQALQSQFGIAVQNSTKLVVPSEFTFKMNMEQIKSGIGVQ